MPDNHDESRMSAASMVKVGVAVAAVAGALVIGGRIAITEVQQYTAYSHASSTTVGMMGVNLSKSVLSARSNFVLGATEGVDIGGTSRKDHRVFYARDDGLGTQYHAAGVSWQKEHQLPAEVLRQISESVLAENEKIEDLQRELTDKVEASFKFRFEAENMVNIAMFRGMLDGAHGLIEIDERIIARSDSFLDDVTPEASEALRQARSAGAEVFDVEVAGNERLFAEVQNSLNDFPKENATFSTRRMKRAGIPGLTIGTEENLSRVERVETASLKLDPRLAGIHDGPDSP